MQSVFDNITLKVGRHSFSVLVEHQGLNANTATLLLLGSNASKMLTEAQGQTKTNLANGKKYIIHKFSRSPVFVNGEANGDELWDFDVELLENPVPLIVLLGGIALLVGLTLSYMTLKGYSPGQAINSAASGIGQGIGFALIIVLAFVTAPWWLPQVLNKAGQVWGKLFSRS